MKKIYLTSLLVLLLTGTMMFSTAQAQSFSVSPSNTVSKTIYSESYTDVTIYIDNLLNDTLILDWQETVNTLPSGWNVLFCDYQACYSAPNIPTSRTMEPIPPGVQAFLKLTINPGTDMSPGTASYEVWEQGNPNDKQTLTFNIDVVVGMEEELDMNVAIFPNPVKESLNVSLGNLTIDELTLVDLQGRTLKNISGSLSGMQQLDMSELNAGIYFLQARAGEAVLTKKVLKRD